MVQSEVFFQLVLDGDQVVVLSHNGIGIDGNIIHVFWSDDDTLNDSRALVGLVLENIQCQGNDLFAMGGIDVAGSKFALLDGLDALARQCVYAEEIDILLLTKLFGGLVGSKGSQIALAEDDVKRFPLQ